MKFAEEFFFSDLSTLHQGLVNGDYGVRDLVEAYADRLEQKGPKYNALALSLRKDAMDVAKDLEGDFKRKRVRSKLQGLPFGAKDLLSVEGKVTTWGAKPFEKQVLPYTATPLKKLAGKGALLIGKLSMVQLAGGGGYRFPAASLQGPGLNPWNVNYWSGGSSSGSGSAVAAGLVPFALGSETSGSILTPAAYCGVTGLRPTYGLVSRYGAMALSWTLDKVGPMCRTAEDCGIVLEAIAGGDGKDPGSARKTFYYAPQLQPTPDKLTAAYAPVDFNEWADESCRPAFLAALDVFKSMGLKLTEKKLPEHPYGPVLSAIITAESASIFEPIIRDGRVDQLADASQIAGLKAGLEVSAIDYLKAMRLRRVISDSWISEFRDVDVIITPSRLGTSTPINQALDAGSSRVAPKERGFSGIIGASNLAGWPAISLPCGFVNGLPVGIQIVAKPWRENQLLALGKRFQELTAHHKQRPPQ